jgi:hypothetical protein
MKPAGSFVSTTWSSRSRRTASATILDAMFTVGQQMFDPDGPAFDVFNVATETAATDARR